MKKPPLLSAIVFLIAGFRLPLPANPIRLETSFSEANEFVQSIPKSESNDIIGNPGDAALSPGTGGIRRLIPYPLIGVEITRNLVARTESSDETTLDIMPIRASVLYSGKCQCAIPG